MYQHIRDNVCRLRAEIPPDIAIVAAVKGRTVDEITVAVDAGINILGENYIQETETTRFDLPGRGKWHFIGHLQLNKVKKAVELFDLIQTVDSIAIARSINKHAAALNKIMPVLIEVNIGREPQKNGVLPENVFDLARSIAGLSNLRLSGLMTMGPNMPAQELRPYFASTRAIYEEIKCLCLPSVDIRYLSMGMSDSYRVAIKEGANMIRLGTAIFGPRR
ncbi:YggS family pyridoxal phosphate-dependent enzyme [Dehalogenimonas etheniformans]|uniref:Pyridoxal phosphate homeostasis protein n=1 Tax=Dehalogenimonas etheniformans TaxID=1536648 RepID=A0A2P5P9L1_9CHLR|nr:YggS family pyridoxal phosphate-dependent enzyme [Dehalogenimonas etheniformans]PPD58964.1 YggS family pyridoxal phosphate-dependent enzyme [Dehalogenimonas etheniformans]QNT76270.1 YggS family pyridoxal phosphate-dependent enzyme [Dehalogenimonas etheniformans]